MDKQELDALNIKESNGSSNEKKEDLKVLNLKEQKESKSYDNLEGTGVKSLRVISSILIVMGVVLFFVGLILSFNSSRYHPERDYMSMAFIYLAISCFLISPIYKVLATIGEAAKIFKDKNTK
ncbi:MAG: hypothetical protein IKZ62_03530 [Prevotella sp.]|nr:hypothetical protein [Prevotella sp.]